MATDGAGPNGSELSERLGPAVTLPLHPEHGWTWTEREREFLERWAGELVAAERERCAKTPLTRQQIDDVMTQHYPLSSLLREEVDAFEACVRDLERLHGIGA